MKHVTKLIAKWRKKSTHWHGKARTLGDGSRAKISASTRAVIYTLAANDLEELLPHLRNALKREHLGDEPESVNSIIARQREAASEQGDNET